jgi:NADP-dependent 3-hydroxy acid dehydrogenase YdfG
VKALPLVMVTGASSGIGAAVARTFSELGHPLLLLSRRLSALRSLNLPKSICIAADVSDERAVQSAVRAGEDEFGRVDCLVNSAGQMLLGEPLEQSADELKSMLDVNVIGTMNAIRSVLPGMVERRRGSIFNVSSITGRQAFPFHSAYCATKFGVHGMSAGLGADLGQHNIRVSTISPGVVDTALIDGTTSASAKAMFREWMSTLESVLHPDDVARAISFAYEQPQHVCMREIFLTSTSQTS